MKQLAITFKDLKLEDVTFETKFITETKRPTQRALDQIRAGNMYGWVTVAVIAKWSSFHDTAIEECCSFSSELDGHRYVETSKLKEEALVRLNAKLVGILDELNPRLGIEEGGDDRDDG